MSHLPLLFPLPNLADYADYGCLFLLIISVFSHRLTKPKQQDLFRNKKLNKLQPGLAECVGICNFSVSCLLISQPLSKDTIKGEIRAQGTSLRSRSAYLTVHMLSALPQGLVLGSTRGYKPGHETPWYLRAGLDPGPEKVDHATCGQTLCFLIPVLPWRAQKGGHRKEGHRLSPKESSVSRLAKSAGLVQDCSANEGNSRIQSSYF